MNCGMEDIVVLRLLRTEGIAIGVLNILQYCRFCGTMMNCGT